SDVCSSDLHEAAAVFHHEGGATEVLDIGKGLEEDLRLGGDFGNVHQINKKGSRRPLENLTEPGRRRATNRTVNGKGTGMAPAAGFSILILSRRAVVT